MDLLKTFFTNVNYDIGAMLKDDQILFFVVSEKPILNLFIRLLFQFTVFLNKQIVVQILRQLFDL